MSFLPGRAVDGLLKGLILSFSASRAGPAFFARGPLRRGATAPNLSPLYSDNHVFKFGFANLQGQAGFPCFPYLPLRLLAHFWGI